MSSTLQAMITYSTELLQSISAWLSAEPMIYFVGALMGCFVINTVFSLINFRRY